MKLIYIILSVLLILSLLFVIIYNRIYSCNYNQNYLKEGKEFLSTKNVAICGLLRDNSSRIKENISKVKMMGDFFNDYTVLVVENDSKDNTRELLLDWAYSDNRVKVLGCDGINLKKCQLNLPPTLIHNTSEKRIKKMAYLRNIYLEELRKAEYKNIDYVIVWDLDLLGNFDLNGLFNLGYRLKYNMNIDAICANGMQTGKYYDTYALRLENDDKNRRRKYVYDKLYMLPYRCNINDGMETEGLVKVKSCFGGFTIYKKNSIVSSTYGTNLDIFGEPICEHEYLSSQLNNVYTDAKLQYYIYEN